MNSIELHEQPDGGIHISMDCNPVFAANSIFGLADKIEENMSDGMRGCACPTCAGIRKLLEAIDKIKAETQPRRRR